MSVYEYTKTSENSATYTGATGVPYDTYQSALKNSKAAAALFESNPQITKKDIANFCDKDYKILQRIYTGVYGIIIYEDNPDWYKVYQIYSDLKIFMIYKADLLRSDVCLW